MRSTFLATIGILATLLCRIAGAQSAPVQPGGAKLPPGEGISRYFWYTRNGDRQPAFFEAAAYGQIELSPNGKFAVVERRNADLARTDPNQRYDLWIVNFKDSTFVRWTLNRDNPRDPVWSPDSHRVAYRVGSGQNRELRQIAVGSSQEMVLDRSQQTKFPDDWIDGGRSLLYHTDGPDTVGMLATASASPRVVLGSPGHRNDLRVSPNGRWIAYGSDESGAWEVHLAGFPSFQQARRISTGGGVQVRWRGDGKELFYLRTDGSMVAQAIDPKSGALKGNPKVLFKTATSALPQVYFYSVTRDGSRFLVLENE